MNDSNQKDISGRFFLSSSPESEYYTRMLRRLYSLDRTTFKDLSQIRDLYYTEYQKYAQRFPDRGKLLFRLTYRDGLPSVQVIREGIEKLENSEEENETEKQRLYRSADIVSAVPSKTILGSTADFWKHCSPHTWKIKKAYFHDIAESHRYELVPNYGKRIATCITCWRLVVFTFRFAWEMLRAAFLEKIAKP